MLTRRGKALLGLWLVLMIGWTGAVNAQGIKYFTGKITEIARASEMEPLKKGNFYLLRLDAYPDTGFRLSSEDAVRYGVIDVTGPSGVVTPKKSKGLGWKVKLTCDGKNLGLNNAPIYKVTSLERLDDR
jgi:hypothetical protein